MRRVGLTGPEERPPNEGGSQVLLIMAARGESRGKNLRQKMREKFPCFFISVSFARLLHSATGAIYSLLPAPRFSSLGL